MPYDPHKHHRRSIRLKGYDYTSGGGYFVTICIQNGQCVLGQVVDGEMILSEWGEIVAKWIVWLEDHYDYVVLDEWCVMPNHIHLIIVLVKDEFVSDVKQGASRSVPPEKRVKRKPLGRLIGAFKTVSSKEINDLQGLSVVRFWQRDFYERVIRNERELNAIRQYIINNPANWQADKLNPSTPSNQFNQNW